MFSFDPFFVALLPLSLFLSISLTGKAKKKTQKAERIEINAYEYSFFGKIVYGKIAEKRKHESMIMPFIYDPL